MAKLSPEVLALVPNGIENLVLHCTVCGGELSNDRRAYGHHSGPCHTVASMHRRYVINLRKCISCLHPSTPKEREEFRQWRKSRGDCHQVGGRQPGKEYTNYPKRAPKKREKTLDNQESVSGTPDIAL